LFRVAGGGPGVQVAGNLNPATRHLRLPPATRKWLPQRFASGQPANWSTGQLFSRASPRISDHPRFFGDRIDLVLEEFELGLERRDFPGEFGVLDDELLEEGEDGLVGIFGFHV